MALADGQEPGRGREAVSRADLAGLAARLAEDALAGGRLRSRAAGEPQVSIVGPLAPRARLAHTATTTSPVLRGVRQPASVEVDDLADILGLLVLDASEGGLEFGLGLTLLVGLEPLVPRVDQVPGGRVLGREVVPLREHGEVPPDEPHPALGVVALELRRRFLQLPELARAVDLKQDGAHSRVGHRADVRHIYGRRHGIVRIDFFG